MSAQLFLTSSFLNSPPTPTSSHSPKFSCNFQPINLKHGQRCASSLTPKPRKKSFTTRADDGDVESGSADDYDMEEEEVEEVDNKKDYDVEYDRLLVASLMPFTSAEVGDDIEMVQGKSFVSTQGWDPEMVVDYRIDEEEFHKISLMNCDFFIRKPPDPDNGVYDFREMYVTPPDTDVYSIPRVLAPMPQKYIRCSKSDYGCYNVTEPPIDAPRDPLYKSSKDILKGMQVFLTKHYRNRRKNDPEFVLDFEEIYVIDSRAKSITRGKVLVTIPEGRNRDRRKDLLIIRDKGNSFKIIPISERDDPTTVIEREEWVQNKNGYGETPEEAQRFQCLKLVLVLLRRWVSFHRENF